MITKQHAGTIRLQIANLVKGEMVGGNKTNALAILQSDQDTIQHLKAIVRHLRGRLGKATKQEQASTEHYLKLSNDLRASRDQHVELVEMLVLLLLAADSYVPGEVTYYVKTQLGQKLAARFPDVRTRLGMVTRELTAASVNQAREELKATDGKA